MKRLCWTLLIAALTACADYESGRARILQLEDRRVSCDSLLIFLNHPHADVRALAVEALGKLQDANCTNALVKMLRDANPNVRIETAFALGQLGQKSAEKPLIDVLYTQEILEVKLRAIEALGKIGSERSIPVLINLMKNPNSVLRAEAALSAGRMALRHFTHPSLSEALAHCLGDQNSEVRWKACYALMRIGKEINFDKLRQALGDSDARVRMYAVQALGNAQDAAALEAFGKILANDRDWRVQVKAANALGKYPLRRIANYVSFSNQPHPVRVALIQALGGSAALEPSGYIPSSREHNLIRHHLEQILITDEWQNDDASRAQPSPTEIGLALISYAQLLKEAAAERIQQFVNHPHPRVRARAMQALVECGAAGAGRIFENTYSAAPAIVKIAILEALAKMKNPEPRIFVQALLENDPVLAALAAQGLSQDSLRNKIYVQPIISAYRNLPRPVDVEVAQMMFTALVKMGDTLAVSVLTEALDTPDQALSKTAADALQKLTGRDYSERVAKQTQPHTNFNYKEIAALNGARAIIQTERGDIEIALHTFDAPLTVLNFVRLAEKGFFDGLTFHRVVPNFVIQGGDPRGDSWGSPGYAIRSEFNKQPFRRGSVGMASAGKDTEGCQFFITHSEQPHLDGRYTVFGQVISGMAVADAIHEDDVMKSVTIRR
jgi:cyclophilin family peptidyl-prolyl cis-trans isomerase/HEAT repeat protein